MHATIAQFLDLGDGGMHAGAVVAEVQVLGPHADGEHRRQVGRCRSTLGRVVAGHADRVLVTSFSDARPQASARCGPSSRRRTGIKGNPPPGLNWNEGAPGRNSARCEQKALRDGNRGARSPPEPPASRPAPSRRLSIWTVLSGAPEIKTWKWLWLGAIFFVHMIILRIWQAYCLRNANAEENGVQMPSCGKSFLKQIEGQVKL